MARVFPERAEVEHEPNLLNPGERQVLDWLSALDDDWLIYVQPRFGLDRPDFIAAHPMLGICAIEVKDWAVGSVAMSPAGVIEVRDQRGWVATTEAPRIQAHRHRAAIADRLRRITDEAPEFCEVAGIVVLPRHTTAQARELLCSGWRHEFEQWVEVWGCDDLEYDPAYVLTGSRHPVPRPVSPACFAAIHNVVCGPEAVDNGPLPLLAARAVHLALAGKEVVVVADDAASLARLHRAAIGRCREIGAMASLITFTDPHELYRRAADDARLWGHDLASVGGPGSSPDDDVHLGIEAYELGFGLRFDAVLVVASREWNYAWSNALCAQALRLGGELMLAREVSDNDEVPCDQRQTLEMSA